MNLYIVVEGMGEKKLYETWIPLVNRSLRNANFISEVKHDCFYIVSGGGYPNYLDIIDDGIDTVNSKSIFDRYVIIIDSENLSRAEKLHEIHAHLLNKRCNIPIHIIVQHFCIETWLLGNRRIGPRNPKSEKVKEYKLVFDVLTNDPEELPPYPKMGFNRSQFALHYLKACLNDHGRNLSYQKANPKAACHPTYFNEIKIRHSRSKHIDSFGDVLNTFI